MMKAYKYFYPDLKEEYCELTFLILDNLDSELSKAMQEKDTLVEKVKEAKDIMDASEVGQEKTNNTNKYLKVCEQFNLAKRKLVLCEENQLIVKRNGNKTIHVERLKDIYSRMESVSVKIFSNGVEDGKIVSTVSKIKEDIYKLGEYGLFLPAPYSDELAQIIIDIYFDLKPIERFFIENNVSETAIRAFYEMCISLVEEYFDSNEQSKDNEFKKIILKDGYYCVPVARFNKWYSESRFKRYSNTELREALIIHNYATANNGRNDYNVTGLGKTIGLKVPNEK